MLASGLPGAYHSQSSLGIGDAVIGKADPLTRKVSLDHREMLNRPTKNWRDGVHMGLLIDGSKAFTV